MKGELLLFQDVTTDRVPHVPEDDPHIQAKTGILAEHTGFDRLKKILHMSSRVARSSWSILGSTPLLTSTLVLMSGAICW